MVILSLCSFTQANTLDPVTFKYHLLSIRRALCIIQRCPIKSQKGAIWPHTLFHTAIAPFKVLNRTSLNNDNALLPLNWWYIYLVISLKLNMCMKYWHTFQKFCCIIILTDCPPKHYNRTFSINNFQKLWINLNIL